jgi:hypothetical protein
MKQLQEKQKVAAFPPPSVRIIHHRRLEAADEVS